MKILVYTDNHFSETSSIILSRGSRFSTRLENAIQSINWAENEALEKECDCVVCLGDFFDKISLNDEEITALREIKWANIPHYFIVGNHESSKIDLKYSSTKILENLGFHIISEPLTWKFENDQREICFLPYITESEKKSLFEYFGKPLGKRIILSHNSIKGINYGRYVSQEGFSIDEIDECCSLFLNGHLHNGGQFSEKGVNLGNITGQRFDEDSFKYSHNIGIIDFNRLISFELIENPYAFNFYKFDIDKEEDFKKLDSLKYNAVVSISCNEKLNTSLRELLKKNPNICEHKITLYREYSSEKIDNSSELRVGNHLKEFSDFVTQPDYLGSDPIVLAELAEVCR